jgi:hypothetical protein
MEGYKCVTLCIYILFARYCRAFESVFRRGNVLDGLAALKSTGMESINICALLSDVSTSQSANCFLLATQQVFKSLRRPPFLLVLTAPQRVLRQQVRAKP